MNLALMQGNIDKPGAGLCPVRGHSNVQGDRTMGIWEKPPAHFLEPEGSRGRSSGDGGAPTGSDRGHKSDVEPEHLS